MKMQNWINPFVLKSVGAGEDKKGPVEIEGLANRHEVDRYKEIIETDAWSKNKGLDDFYKNPIVLFNHDQDFPIGTVTEALETSEGLKVKIKLSESDDPITTRIRNLIKEGIIRSFSVGFMPVQEEKDGDVTRIKEARLHEVSAVSIPVQQSSQFAVKGPQKGGKKQIMMKALDELLRKKGEDNQEGEEDEKGFKTSSDHGHSHKVELDAESGDGKTVGLLDGEAQPHEHEVKDRKVLPSGEDEHTHELIDTVAQATEGKGEGEEGEEPEEGVSEFEKQLEDGKKVQSVIYAMDKFGAEEAEAHAKENGFKTDTVESHPEYGMISVVQRDVSEFNKESFDKKELEDGVVVVVGEPSSADNQSEDREDDSTQDSDDEGQSEDEKSLKNTTKKGENDAQVIIDNETPSNDVGEQPQFEVAKQTNILLGQVVMELQKLNKAVEGLGVEKEVVEAGNPDPQADDALAEGKGLDKLDGEVKQIEAMARQMKMLTGYVANLEKDMSALGV